MWKLVRSWYHKGLYEDAERLDIQVAEWKTGMLGAAHNETLDALYRVGVIY